ncbi:APC family permease [Brevibacillus fluminis]|uniref:APC family permease n=1 Tax=Brevibacillus fluminis TaxID=511487 RepID=UPI001FED281E|nr:APC family permease [Brevibacillus fluminis]
MNSEIKLQRSLTLLPAVLFGLAFMSLGTVFSTFGIASVESHGMIVGSYILALVVMLFTAYSYGQMAKAYPISGAAYSYVQRSIHPHLGFMVGWSILMDYLFTPMVNFLLFRIYFAASFPSVPEYVWVLLMIVTVGFVNIKGITLASIVNRIIISSVVLFLLIFCILSIHTVLNGTGTATLATSTPVFNPQESFSLLVAGAAILCFSFLGFDSVSTLSEETINPEKTIPKAIFISTLIGGLIFIFVAYVTYCVWPDYTTFKDPSSVSLDIIKLVGGNVLAAFFLAVKAVGFFASAVASQASTSRVLYSMGRDGQLPRSFFGTLHPKFQTPVNNILLISAFSLLALFLSLDLVASFINFGAFFAFTCVNIAVIKHYFIDRKQETARSFKSFLSHLLVPAIGAGLDIWMLINLDGYSKLLGAVWFVIGLVYLAFKTRGFRRKSPSIPEADRIIEQA